MWATKYSMRKRVFLKDRDMMKNLLEIDTAAQKVMLQCKTGAIILFDFSVAFPSLAHEMIWDTLEEIGIDPSFIRVVKAFIKRARTF